MDRKYYIFVVVPGAHGKLRKVHMSPYLVQIILGFAIAGAVTVGALANTYARMLLKVSNYNTLRAQREALKVRCHRMEGAITRTNVELQSLQSLAAEVALAYNFSDGGRTRFPSAVLKVASRGIPGLGADYNASLYALNMMRVKPLLASYPSSTSSFLGNKYDDTSTPSIWPVQGVISAAFGQRVDPFTGEGAFHTGIDIAAPVGTPVRAAAEGILFHAGPESGYGNEVLIDHGFGLATKYGHLSALYVVDGEEVSRGQIIGAVGVTGRTTGPHLHYEVLVNGTPVDPAKYLPE
jgi:murein DD-endopeptidase MepM/ murein hydrolase activator NlpD